jgi:hypothetical protein
LPISAFDYFWSLADGKGKNVKLDKEEFRKLLLDHSTVLNRLSRMNVRLDEPEFEEGDYPSHPKVRSAESS